ncbi:MAG TPA: FecR domain-containing protein, partial [Polyangiaceae bacterium]
MRVLVSVLTLLIGVCLLALTSCRCADEGVLATLENRQGQVDRDTKAQPKSWSDAAIGATFSMGDALRTRETSTASLALDDGSQLSVRPKTVLRFSDTPPKAGEQGFDVETGEALLEVGDAGLVLRTSLGLARIDGKSQVLVRRTTGGMRFEVHVGRAVIETADGKKNELERGQGIVVGVGQAVLDKPGPAASAAATASASPDLDEPLPVAGDISGHVVGGGVSVQRPASTSFAALAPGAVQVPSGSTVKVKQGSTLTLHSGGASAALAGNGTYLLGGAGGTLVQVRQGSVALSGGRTSIAV